MKRYPDWLKEHLYHERNFHDLTGSERQHLKTRLQRFQHDAPEITIAIPAYNEEDNLYRTLSTLAANNTQQKVEIIVINNNSTDGTQDILDALGVRNYFQSKQGIAYARQLGLEKARGQYHLCADADTLYPPTWIDEMTAPMKTGIYLGVYGRYSILVPEGQSLWMMRFYEFCTGVLFRLRKRKREFINVLGFNMGFVTNTGRQVKGFEVPKVRKGSNAETSSEYTEMSEDGFMAMKLAEVGKLKFLTSRKIRVYTSARKVLSGGSLPRVLIKKVKVHLQEVYGYYRKKSHPL